MNCPSCNAENVEGARFCAKCGALMPIEAPEERDTLIGQKVGGRYTIKRMLGEGGMGRVYEAEQAIAGVIKRMAVKTLHPHLSKDPQVVARFNRECATVAGLKHNNTIRVEDFGQADDGTLYIAMEFVEGPSVAKELETLGPMPPERVEHIMKQVCGSLAEAHKQGIVHRDLKPENIVLTNVGDDVDVVKVLDFGIAARKEKGDAQKEQKLTQQGMVLGTPPYMSPEQFMGKELDPRSDIYSLGVMAYEMLTGRLPFDANTPWEWATKHMTAQPFPFEDSPTVTDVPGKMKQAILRALEKDPTKRHANVREFFEDLSSGGARMSRATSPELQQHPAGGGPTAAMESFDTGGQKGMTQIGTPLAAPFDPGPGAGVGAATPPPFAVPPAPPPPVVTGGNQGGPNKGLLFGLGGAGLLIVLVSGVMLAKSMGSKDHPTGPLDIPSAGGPATVAPLASGPDSVPTTPVDSSGVKPHVTGLVPTGNTNAGTTQPPPTKLSGDEACNDASKRAGNGDAMGALGAYHGCSGPGQAAAKRNVAASVGPAVQKAVFQGDCKKARSIAAAGSAVGSSPNVDSQYPQCKGK